jgi:sarcosine oxidase subunit alpha
MTTDVLILGGGPAGLAAAYEVASRGYKATIVDEARALGGQLRSQTQLIAPMPPAFSGLRGFQLADKLVSRLDGLPVEYCLQREAIGLYADGSVGVSDGKKIEKLAARKIVVATGWLQPAPPNHPWYFPDGRYRA